MVTRKLMIGTYLFGIILMMTSCNDKLDIQQMYPFTVITMPVQSRIQFGETAEIRFQLHREGYYNETKYFIRYFQTDGKGILKMADGTLFLPNDLYPLPTETFRLYYTSASTDQQRIDIYIEDNFGQMEVLSFSWQNENIEEEELEE